MASRNQVAGKKKTNDETPKKTPGSLSNQEKKDLPKKIKNLEDENQRLSLENVMLKNNFDLRESIKALSRKGVPELDAIEIANDMVKMALHEADERHSAEKMDMEKKHKKEIEKLSQNKQGADQLPTQSTKTHGSLSDQEKKDLAQKIKNLEDENKRLSLENVMLKNNFDLREILKALSRKGVPELDAIEIANDMVKMALHEADERHSAEKMDMEKKHKKEIEKLSQNKQGADQLPTQSTKTHGSLSDQEKKDLAQKIKNLEDENKRLSLENVMLKNNFDLREILKALSRKGVPELDAIEIANDMVKMALHDADERHSAEKMDMEKKYKKEIEKLSQNLQGADQLPTQSTGDSKHSQETDEDIAKYKEQNKALKREVVSLKADKDELNNNIKQLKTEKESLTKKLKKTDELLSKKETEITDLNNELENLTTRLREVASTQLTLNNPNIDELSDAFRPTKLSERYSQLYDNMWADAFEEHSGKKEEDVIKMLRNVLMGSYKFCENVCREFTVQLTISTLALPNSKPKIRDIPIGYKKQLQEIKKNFGVFLRNDVKESYRKQNTIEDGDKTKNYADACVELCWLMVIQEPPVVIETPASKDSAFDTNMYRAYTTTGTKVDFVVWPALRLHEGGPLLSKGVAQGKK